MFLKLFFLGMLVQKYNISFDLNCLLPPSFGYHYHFTLPIRKFPHMMNENLPQWLKLLKNKIPPSLRREDIYYSYYFNYIENVIKVIWNGGQCKWWEAMFYNLSVLAEYKGESWCIKHGELACYKVTVVNIKFLLCLKHNFDVLEFNLLEEVMNSECLY